MFNTAVLQGQNFGDFEPMPVSRRPGLGLYAFAIACALVGGVLALVGAIFQELVSGGLISLALVTFTAAPIIEEALKPAGVYFLFIRRSNVVSSRLRVAVLSALGGLAFALGESLLYVATFHGSDVSAFALYRFTAPVLMHVVASFTVGLGLSSGLFDWAKGATPFPKRTRNFYAAAVLLHATFNITAVALVLTGVLSFG